MHLISFQVTLTDFKYGKPTVIGNSYRAVYGSFSVGSESENYKLSIGQYDVTTSTLADGFTSGDHNGAPFSTSDRNNAGSCATDFFSGMNITSVLDENYITKDIILQLNTVASFMHCLAVLLHRMVVQQLRSRQFEWCKLLWLFRDDSTEYCRIVSSKGTLA